MYYNIHVAASVTTQGRSLVSTLGMFFESFLANNVKFGSMNEVVTFIHNVITEKPDRHWKDENVLDRNITAQEAYIKIMLTCGFEWIPTEDEMQAVWDIINNLGQEDINRLYYKNNLYEFVLKNSKVLNMIKVLLRKLNKPYLNPNECPEEIEVELGVFKDVVGEYVYYRYHMIDRIDRMDNMIKCVTSLSDTDSTIVSFDAWYNCILEQVKGDPEIKIDKYAKGDSNHKLADAHFDLYRTATRDEIDAGLAVKIPHTDIDGILLEADKVTDVNGVAEFKKYEANADKYDYYLVETKAPSGYNLLTEAIKVNFTDAQVEATAGIYTVEVENSDGFTLPQTGGIGTAIFTAVGIAIMGVAVVMLIVTKKKKSNSAN